MSGNKKISNTIFFVRLLAFLGIPVTLVAGIIAFLLIIVIIVAGNNSSSAVGCVKATTEQAENARLIIQAATTLDLGDQAARVGVIAAAGESSLINVSYGDNAINPDGSVADSIGLFQQQGSWGTVEQRMDPVHAATSFFIGSGHDRRGGLVSVPGWEDMEPTVAIHKTQRNADPDHYTRFYALADEAIRQLTEDLENQDNKCGSSVEGQDANDDYPWFDQPTWRQVGTGSTAASPLGYYHRECVDFVAWRLNRDAKVTGTPWRWTNSNLTFGNGNASQWKQAWETHGWTVSQTPVVGAVAWWSWNHVAYVQSVDLENKTVVLEEYNNPADSHSYNLRSHAPFSVAEAYLYPPPA